MATLKRSKYLRVYHSHRNGFTTVPATLTSTAKELCDTLAKKSKVPLPQDSQLCLYVCESSDHHLFERKLDDHDLPLQIQETVKKHHHDGSRVLKFILRARQRLAARGRIGVQRPDDVPPDVDDPDSGLDSDEELFPPPLQGEPVFLERNHLSGWLELRTQNVWKRRWLELQSQGSVVRIYKSPFHPNHIGTFRLSETIVRRPRGMYRSMELIFEVNTGRKVILCRAQNEDELQHWVQIFRQQSRSDAETAVMDHLNSSAEELAVQAAVWEEERMERMMQLSGVLEDPSGLSHFMQHVVETHCEENLLFWMDAEFYRLVDRKDDDLLELRKQIFDRYVRPGAALEIALNSAHRTRLLQALEESTPDPEREFFVDAQQSTFQLMQNHDWHAFQEGPLFQSVLLGLPISRSLELRHFPICRFARHQLCPVDPPDLELLQLPLPRQCEDFDASQPDAQESEAESNTNELSADAMKQILNMIPSDKALLLPSEPVD